MFLMCIRVLVKVVSFARINIIIIITLLLLGLHFYFMEQFNIKQNTLNDKENLP